jgi:hypothetical protein
LGGGRAFTHSPRSCGLSVQSLPRATVYNQSFLGIAITQNSAYFVEPLSACRICSAHFPNSNKMKQLLLLFLAIPTFLYTQSDAIILTQNGRIHEQRRATLADLVKQSDFIALVQLPNLSADSLPYSVHDLGTGTFMLNFTTITIYKQTFPLDVNNYLFEHSTNEKIGSNVFIQGEQCYLFLNNNEPKTIGDASDLRLLKEIQGVPSLLLGGLIPKSDLQEKDLKRLCEPSSFVKAMLNNDIHALQRMARKHIDFLNQFDENSSILSFFSFPNWLMSMQGIDGVMLDSCATHIAIWPGWSDYFFWVNTPDGRKEYQLVVQEGKTKMFPLSQFKHGTSSEWVLKNVIRTEGAREGLIDKCEQEALNRKRDAYNYIVRLYLNEGRLNWSTHHAPAHLDSEGDLLRLKLSLYNTIDSAMFLRWPANQNSGRKLFQFVLQEKSSRKMYRELSNSASLVHDETVGPANHLVIAQDTISAWHSINDPFLEYSDVTAAHRFEKLPPGEYQLWVVYDPYPEAVDDTLCWLPYCDSLSAYSGYSFWILEDTVQKKFHIEAEVIQGSESFVNTYGQHGFTNGVVKVLKNDGPNGPAKGSIIAWKLLSEPDFIWDTIPHSHPPTNIDLLHPGLHIELDLIDSNAGGTVKTSSGTFRLYGTSGGLDAVQIKP